MGAPGLGVSIATILAFALALFDNRRARLVSLAIQSFAHPAQNIVLAEYIQAIEDAAVRLDRLTEQVAEAMASWSMGPVIKAY
jgi:transposase